MTMETLAGMLLVVLAGLGTGTIAWPMKIMHRLRFEHYWFVGMLVGLVLLPWVIVLTSVPDPCGVYAEVGWRPILLSNLCGAGWGVANVLYGVCVLRIGAALTGAIMTGLGVVVGVTLPMLLKGTGRFADAPAIGSDVGLIVMAGVAVMLLGVVVSSLAGFGRDRAMASTNRQATSASSGFLSGLILVTVAGVLSCGIALAFVYGGSPIVAAAKARGAGEVSANFAVWAVGLLGGALVNIVYPAAVMTRNHSWAELAKCPRDLALGAAIGIQFIVAIALLGMGMLILGPLGPAVGFGIQQAMQIMGNQAVGFASGEWKGVRGTPRTQMYAALLILIVAVVILAYAKSMGQG